MVLERASGINGKSAESAHVERNLWNQMCGCKNWRGVTPEEDTQKSGTCVHVLSYKSVCEQTEL